MRRIPSHSCRRRVLTKSLYKPFDTHGPARSTWRVLSISLTDEKLMVRVGQGDAKAFAELHRRHGGRVYLQARALCATAEQAEDVTQEAFLSVWRLALAFDPQRGTFGTWMAAIVRNRTTDAWRRAAARPAEVGFPLDPAHMQLAAEDRRVSASIERAALRELVAMLPPEQRDAIFLAYFEDLTVQEIASRVGVPLGTAKSRMRLGLAKLRMAAADAQGVPMPAAA